MNEPVAIEVPATTIVVHLDAEAARLVARLAAKRGQSSEAFAAEAIQRVAESEADFDAFIQIGIDAINTGDVVSQEAMESWFEQRVAARHA